MAHHLESTKWINHHLFSHSSVDRHVGCFQFVAVREGAADISYISLVARCTSLMGGWWGCSCWIIGQSMFISNWRGYLSSFVKCLFKSFAHFEITLLAFFLTDFRSSLYFLDTSSLLAIFIVTISPSLYLCFLNTPFCISRSRFKNLCQCTGLAFVILNSKQQTLFAVTPGCPFPGDIASGEVPWPGLSCIQRKRLWLVLAERLSCQVEAASYPPNCCWDLAYIALGFFMPVQSRFLCSPGSCHGMALTSASPDALVWGVPEEKL